MERSGPGGPPASDRASRRRRLDGVLRRRTAVPRWSPGTTVIHECRPDTYRGLVDVAADRQTMRVVWDVSGPGRTAACSPTSLGAECGSSWRRHRTRDCGRLGGWHMERQVAIVAYQGVLADETHAFRSVLGRAPGVHLVTVGAAHGEVAGPGGVQVVDATFDDVRHASIVVLPAASAAIATRRSPRGPSPCGPSSC